MQALHPAAHARDTGCDPAVLDARLAPDMLPFAAQVRLATDIATQVVEKLIGYAAPNFPEEDAKFHRLTGETYVLRFALPNFFFHVTTTYDILRHLGVELGKRDYLVAFVCGQ